MSLEITPVLDKQEWDSLIKESGGHPLQLWGWGELKAAHRWRAARFRVQKNGNDLAFAQVLTRSLPGPFGGFAYVPRGPQPAAGTSKEELAAANDALAKYIKKSSRTVAVSIEPDIDSKDFVPGNGWRQAKNPVLPARTLILDLTKSEEDLLKDMTKKHRQYVRKSGREESIEIKAVTTKDELARCLEIYHETSKRADFGLHEDSYYYDAFEKLGENASVWASYVAGSPVAFLFMAHSSETAFELYGGMNDVGQQLRANYALKWHAICEMKKMGARRYDLGGLINDGVTNFKTGFASHENLLAGSWDMPGVGYGLFNRAVPMAQRVLAAIRRK